MAERASFVHNEFNSNFSVDCCMEYCIMVEVALRNPIALVAVCPTLFCVSVLIAYQIVRGIKGVKNED